MPVWMMLKLFPSTEITDLAALYLIEDERAKNQDKDVIELDLSED